MWSIISSGSTAVKRVASVADQIKSVLFWSGAWVAGVLAICSAGALAGALLFPVAGHLLGMDLRTGEMIRNGAFDGGFLALIWAPGLSFVGCLMWGHGRSRSRSGSEG